MNNYTDISLCSKALLKIGASTISSFLDGTAEAEVASNLYPLIRDGLLSSHPWSFATTQNTLGLLAQKPIADYSNSFQLPPELLRIISAGNGYKGQGITYRIKENTLHTNSQKVTLTYIYRPLEKNFPAFFADALVSRLAAEFCLPLTESTSRAEYLTKLAEEEVKKARLIDSQQDTPLCFDDFSLVEIRQ